MTFIMFIYKCAHINTNYITYTSQLIMQKGLLYYNSCKIACFLIVYFVKLICIIIIIYPQTHFQSIFGFIFYFLFTWPLRCLGLRQVRLAYKPWPQASDVSVDGGKSEWLAKLILGAEY